MSSNWFVPNDPLDVTKQHADANGTLRIMDAEGRRALKNAAGSFYAGGQVTGELTLVALSTIIPLGPEDAALMAAGEGIALALESQLAKKGLGILYDKISGTWYAFRKDGKALNRADNLAIATEVKAAINKAPNSALTVGEDVFAGARGRDLSKLTNKEIGDLGEGVAQKFLKDNKYTDIFAVQNKSGNGIDIVARTPDGRLAFFEVKTSSVGKVGELSARQANMTDFVRDILRQASTGTGRYKGLDVATQNRAAQMLREFNAAPQNASGTVVGVDLLNEIIRVSPWAK